MFGSNSHNCLKNTNIQTSMVNLLLLLFFHEVNLVQHTQSSERQITRRRSIHIGNNLFAIDLNQIKVVDKILEHFFVFISFPYFVQI